MFRKKRTVVFASQSVVRGSVASAAPRSLLGIQDVSTHPDLWNGYQNSQAICMQFFGKYWSRGFVVNQKGWEGRFITSEVRAHTVCGQQHYSAQQESKNTSSVLTPFRIPTLTKAYQITPLFLHTCLCALSIKSNEERKGGKQEMLREKEGEREGGQGKRGESHMFCLFCFIWSYIRLEVSYL